MSLCGICTFTTLPTGQGKLNAWHLKEDRTPTYVISLSRIKIDQGNGESAKHIQNVVSTVKKSLGVSRYVCHWMFL